MATITGVTQCTYTGSVEDSPRHGSGGDGYKERIDGVHDWEITIEQLARQAGPDAAKGTFGQLVINETAASSCVFDSGSSGAFCANLENVYDLDTGAQVGRTYTFRGNGAPDTDWAGGSGATAFSAKNGTFAWTAA